MRRRAQRREASAEMAETDLHSVFVFQVRRDRKCFDACWAAVGLKYRWRQLNVPRDFGTDTSPFSCACY